MEKIYIEESQKTKKKKLNVSVVLSFIVAIFAVLSLVVAGFSQISYAAPDTSAVESFNFEAPSIGVSGFASDDNTGTAVYAPLYFSDSALTKAVFCVEKNHGVSSDAVTYKKKDKIEDYGLLYLLNNSFANGKKMLPDSLTSKYTEAWATQIAIWVYLADTNPTKDVHKLNDGGGNSFTLDDVRAVKSLYYVDRVANDTGRKTSSVSIYDTYIEPYVTAAKNATKARSLSVRFASEDIAKVDNVDFYQTSQVNITGDELISFDVSVGGIDGAILVNDSGETLTTTTNLAPGTKIFVRIPADKVTETAQTLTVSATGHFSTLGGYYYQDDNEAHQLAVTVYGTTTDDSSSDSIEVIGTPDTGMSKAQTIYFIGLIVLLCGVGIVYANAKPVESK